MIPGRQDKCRSSVVYYIYSLCLDPLGKADSFPTIQYPVSMYITYILKQGNYIVGKFYIYV